MGGVADLALGLAPVAAGIGLGAMVGYVKGPDIRKALKQDLELLDQLPLEQAQRRAELQRTIDTRIDDLIATVDRYRLLRKAAVSYRGDVRDFMLFFCAVLFTGVWWGVDHHKTSWLPMFVVLIVVSVLTAWYAFRSVRSSVARLVHRND
jgi:hypothetical protein